MLLFVRPQLKLLDSCRSNRNPYILKETAAPAGTAVLCFKGPLKKLVNKISNFKSFAGRIYFGNNAARIFGADVQ